MEFIYTLYNYLRSNLGTVLFVCLYVTLAIYPIKRFIREKITLLAIDSLTIQVAFCSLSAQSLS